MFQTVLCFGDILFRFTHWPDRYYPCNWVLHRRSTDAGIIVVLKLIGNLNQNSEEMI